jgi:hypothetical protein
MRLITRFEGIEGWQKARERTREFMSYLETSPYPGGKFRRP